VKQIPLEDKVDLEMIYEFKNLSQADKLLYEFNYRGHSYQTTQESASEEVIYDMLFQITVHENLPVVVITNKD